MIVTPSSGSFESSTICRFATGGGGGSGLGGGGGGFPPHAPTSAMIHVPASPPGGRCVISIGFHREGVRRLVDLRQGRESDVLDVTGRAAHHRWRIDVGLDDLD